MDTNVLTAPYRTTAHHLAHLAHLATRAALSGAYAVDLSHVLRTLYIPFRCAILVVIRYSLSASDLLTEGFSIA